MNAFPEKPTNLFKPSGAVRATRLLIGALCILLAAAAVVGWLLIRHFFGPPPGGGEKVVVEIPRGAPIGAIGEILQNNGVICDARAFVYTAKRKGLAAQLKAGEYALPLGAQLEEILRLLVEGRVLEHRLTVPEGYTLRQIAQVFSEAGIGEPDEAAIFSDPEFLKTLRVPGDTLEGYCFPDTYAYIKGTMIREMLARMVRKHFSVFREEKSALKTTPPLPDFETVILASICEKEARRKEELPVIARVYLNRLARGMRLQADPTVIYGIPDFSGTIMRLDLERPSPYNTYLNKGLPPGPICNPGRPAIRAALEPDDSAFFYFVAQSDGSHRFSETYEEHLKAVKEYRKGRR